LKKERWEKDLMIEQRKLDIEERRLWHEQHGRASKSLHVGQESSVRQVSEC